MLVLSRKIDQSIVIDGSIRITVLEVSGDRVKLGIVAPREVSVLRQELHDEIVAENLRAAQTVDGAIVADALRAGTAGVRRVD
ncbi:MAG: carbon storage regulator CsrA [Chloroflexi bacterium]|nr:carbon storage regulator CsrA [Chloroflexota bacterium]